MSDPLNVVPRRLVPIAGLLAWTPADLPPSEQMIPLGAEHAAELSGEGPTPRLDALTEELRRRLDHGRGFALLRGLPMGDDPAAPLRALAARLGTPVPAAPATGRRHVEACDALLLRATAPAATALRPAAGVHNTLLRTDRAALAALYEARGEPPVPVFSNDGGVFAARWDDEVLPADRLPAALTEALGEPLALGLRAGDILALNPFLVWADRVPGALAEAARGEPSRLDNPAFAGLA
ncbi:hypothetical protein EAH89_13870 [Roseomonas nepalensis]|uniref:Uncharacterized protein n=1 Tax=Muricoccus nepalensis TaxID=1854500 RepID=A0A502G1K8_9PROT|nr:hypothetical protein [Roseomonas nepalensis]TPG55655.1 hypothetical protein EAH89_13870 [Roseomonas nepalensis]